MAVPRRESADVRSAADAEVEDARVDRRRNGRRVARDRCENFRLEYRVVERCEDPEQHREHDHRADGDGCRLPEEEHDRDSHETPAQQEKAALSIHPGENEAREDAADPEQHECRRNQIGRERRDIVQERFDVAVHREVRRCKECRHDVNARKRRLADERRQFADGEPLSRCPFRQEKREIDKRDGGNHGEQQERHAPPRRQTDHTPEREPDNRRDGAARHNHAERHRPMLARHETRRKRCGNRPENRVRAGDDDACAEQHIIARRESRDELPDAKERDHQEQEPFQLHAAGQQHERQREQRDHPRIDRDHLPRRRLRHGERLRDINEQGDRYELGCVEDKCGNRNAEQRHILTQWNSHSKAPMSKYVPSLWDGDRGNARKKCSQKIRYAARSLCGLVLFGQVHLAQQGGLHQIRDAVGELVLDAAAQASEPRSDFPLLHAVDRALDAVDVEVALTRRARQRPLLERHAVRRDVASAGPAVARQHIARRQRDGHNQTDRAVVARVDRPSIVSVEARLARFARRVGQSLLGGETRDKLIRRRGKVVVHLPVGGTLLFRRHLRSIRRLPDGEPRVRYRGRRTEGGADEEAHGSDHTDRREHFH